MALEDRKWLESSLLKRVTETLGLPEEAEAIICSTLIFGDFAAEDGSRSYVEINKSEEALSALLSR